MLQKIQQVGCCMWSGWLRQSECGFLGQQKLVLAEGSKVTVLLTPALVLPPENSIEELPA